MRTSAIKDVGRYSLSCHTLSRGPTVSTPVLLNAMLRLRALGVVLRSTSGAARRYWTSAPGPNSQTE
jgi:hypothetical protein